MAVADLVDAASVALGGDQDVGDSLGVDPAAPRH
jgi:hypothetical protein